MAGIRNLMAVGDSITVSLAASTNHQEGTLPTGNDAVLVQNEGPATARVLVSAGTEVATTANLPILPGGMYVLRKRLEANHYSVLADGGAVKVHLTPCESD
ncbi:hypothetical protein UFOVP99_27 [uncultured Caudovirales phage]|uniref:Uncharacterized protein n=1 Tax=uncultured Caudovirales phage TaxID=2100421 RepID=A0A6J5L513_9CAUD|nr:hypothetical protein UFOVP99_27 [uncultured Caudovirales phage]